MLLNVLLMLSYRHLNIKHDTLTYDMLNVFYLQSATTQSHVHAQIQQLTRSSVSQATIKDYLHHVATRSAAGSIPAVNGAVHNGVDGVDVESKARTTASKPAGRAEIMQDIPAELQGVSVRDLIKALGMYGSLV